MKYNLNKLLGRKYINYYGFMNKYIFERRKMRVDFKNYYLVWSVSNRVKDEYRENLRGS